MIADAAPISRAEKRLPAHLETAVFQGPQASGQVPAIHRRNEKRLERREGSGVVPVEEVAVVSREARCRRQTLFGFTGKFGHGQISELIGGQACVQQKP